MRLRPALLITGFAVLIVLPGSAAGGGRGVIAVPGSVGGPPVVISRHSSQRHPFKAAGLGRPFFSPSVGNPVVVVPVPVAVPVPVTVEAPSSAEAAWPPPEEPSRRPAVVNPGPKIIDISPPAPGAKTVTITVHQGSSTLVETVPVR